MMATDENSTPQPQPGRIVYGLKAISERLGLTERQARHLHDKGDLPTRKKGKRVCATEGALQAWVRDLEGGHHG